MSTALRGVALALGVLAVAALVSDGHAAPAQSSSQADDLLAGARTAAAHASYAGVLLVEWRDGGRTHETEAYAHVNDGTVELGGGDNRILSQGDQRWVGAPGDWSLVLGPGVGAAAPPNADAYWVLRTAAGPTVAGDPTELVLAQDPHTGATRARYFIDRANGMLVRRDLLDPHGGLVREVAFEALVPAGSAPELPEQAPPARRDEPAGLTALPSGYRGPTNLGPGYRLLGRYRQPDGTVQLYYGDGIFTLSLFEQRGTIDWTSMPAGSDQTVGGVQTRTYGTPTSSAVVWGSHGLVVTCVSDAPPDQVLLAVRDALGGTTSSSFGDRVARFVLGPFGWN